VIVQGGDVHRGVHEAIVPRGLFDAVERRLAANAVTRRDLRKRSPHLLTGILFDDRGNAMSPSHGRKNGVAYRYYVSQALLQHRKDEAGSAPRVPAPEVEALVVEALQRDRGEDHSPQAPLDRAELLRRVERVVVSAKEITITLVDPPHDEHIGEVPPTLRRTLRRPWSPKPLIRHKGVRHAPDGSARLDDTARTALLLAIAKARSWVDDLVAGRIGSFAEVGEREGLGARYVARLALLAFLSPRIVAAIASGTVPPGTTISALTDALPIAWRDQEERFGIRPVDAVAPQPR